MVCKGTYHEVDIGGMARKPVSEGSAIDMTRYYCIDCEPDSVSVLKDEGWKHEMWWKALSLTEIDTNRALYGAHPKDGATGTFKSGLGHGTGYQGYTTYKSCNHKQDPLSITIDGEGPYVYLNSNKSYYSGYSNFSGYGSTYAPPASQRRRKMRCRLSNLLHLTSC